MKWEQYQKRVSSKAKKLEKTDEYICAYLAYAKPLFDQGVPVIIESSHFSGLVGFDHEYVCKMAYASKYFYRNFTIKKSNGKERHIDEPLPDLKLVQKWILSEILSMVQISPYAKAYAKGRSIKQNARFHRAQKAVVSLDIQDFFPSICFKDVFNIFNDLGYKKNISSFLANLCCLDGKLPQGAPTSPCLSNIRMVKIDQELSLYCKENNWRYTRYSDDLTFSGDANVHNLIKIVSNTLYQNGFILNSKKTRVARKNTRQEVTGIVVNRHMQVPKQDRKQLRQQVYYIRKFGLDSHLDHINETRRNYLRHLLGKANFALYINPNDEEMRVNTGFIKELLQISKSE